MSRQAAAKPPNSPGQIIWLMLLGARGIGKGLVMTGANGPIQ